MNPNTTFDPISTDLRVLTNFQQIESFSAFNSVYNNSGLFGIYAVTVSFSPGASFLLKPHAFSGHVRVSRHLA
jgi:hypothetical protein